MYIRVCVHTRVCRGGWREGGRGTALGPGLEGRGLQGQWALFLALGDRS